MDKEQILKFISTLNSIIPDKDIKFFIQIISSGILDTMPYVKLLNGDILMGKRNRVNELYTDVFDKYEELFDRIGIKKESLGTAYDALVFYHYENCSNGFYRKSDLISQGCTILDVGSRSGHFAVKASRYLGGRGRVVCIDAAEIAKHNLNLHINYNGLNNVEFINCLVGDIDNKECKFFFGSDNETYSGIFQETYLSNGKPCIQQDVHKQFVVLPMKTIDSIVKEYNLDNIGFISFQLNGAEAIALKGANQTLMKYKPNIYSTAFMQTNEKTDPKEEFFKILIPLGYECLLESEEEVIFIHPNRY